MPHPPTAAAPLAPNPPSPRSVSIVVCNHNYARYLPEAVASALDQTQACEVIVVDDGSTDGSRAWLRQVDSRVRVVLQPNGGQVAAYNTGFAHCHGEVVIFLDADDALAPEAAETMARLFDDGVAKVHCRLQMMDGDGHPLPGVLPGTLADGELAAALRRHGLLYPSPPGSGNAYRAAALRLLFPLPVDPVDKVGADFFAIYGAVAFGRVVACDRVLGRYRVHRRASAKDGAAADGEPLVFGNAAQGNDEAAKVATRYARLVALLRERTGGAVCYPPRFIDFSVQKSTYAMAVVGRPWAQAVVGSGPALAALLKALWLQPAYGLVKKLGLTGWALAVLLAPRTTAFRLARHVCDPARRAA